MLSNLWKEILEILPPLLLLFFLAFSPVIMRFLQKRVLRFEEKKKANKKAPLQNAQAKEEALPLEEAQPDENQPGRIVKDSSDFYTSVGAFSEKTGSNPALQRIEKLPPLQKAIVWAEILGSPGGRSDF